MLECGYALTMTAGVLASASDARAEPVWHTRFADGEVTSRPEPDSRWEDP